MCEKKLKSLRINKAILEITAQHLHTTAIAIERDDKRKENKVTFFVTAQ